MEKNLQDVLNDIHRQSLIIDYITIAIALIFFAFLLYFIIEYFTVSDKIKSDNNNGLKPALVNYKRKNKGPNMSTIRAPHNN